MYTHRVHKIEKSVSRWPWQVVAVRIVMHVHSARLIGPASDVEAWDLCSFHGCYLAGAQLLKEVE